MEAEVPRDLESWGWEPIRGCFALAGGSPFGTPLGKGCAPGPGLCPVLSKDDWDWTNGEDGEPAAGVWMWDGAPDGELTEEGREPPRLGWDRRTCLGSSTPSGESGLAMDEGGRKMWACRLCWWVRAMATLVVAAAVCSGACTRGSQITGLPLSSRPTATCCRPWMLRAMSQSCLTICWTISLFTGPELCSARFRSKMEFFLPGQREGIAEGRAGPWGEALGAAPSPPCSRRGNGGMGEQGEGPLAKVPSFLVQCRGADRQPAQCFPAEITKGGGG